jgi:hypothetical protein
MSNPLRNEPDYNNKLRQRKQDYLDLFERKLTIPITEKLYEELISDEAPERIGIIQETSPDKGKAKVVTKRNLQLNREKYIGRNVNLRAESAESRKLVEFLGSHGNSDASTRRFTLTITEDLYQELTLPAAPNQLVIIEETGPNKGRATVVTKRQLQRNEEIYMGRKVDLSGISGASKALIAFLARSTAPGAAPNDPKTTRKKEGKYLKEPKGSYVSNPKKRKAYSKRAMEQSQLNAEELHEELLANNAREMRELEDEYEMIGNNNLAGYETTAEGKKKKKKKKGSKKRKPSANVKGRKPSAKVKGRKPSAKVKGRKPSAKVKVKGKSKSKGRGRK